MSKRDVFVSLFVAINVLLVWVLFTYLSVCNDCQNLSLVNKIDSETNYGVYGVLALSRLKRCK